MQRIKLKYFIVSEYGEMRNRLHYHAIFFLKGISDLGLPRQLWKEILEHTWNKGFCSAYYLTNTWARYAVKYMEKKYNMLLSSRLGFDAYKEYNGVDFECTEDYRIPVYNIQGTPYNIPRSWLDKIRFVRNGKEDINYRGLRMAHLQSNPPPDPKKPLEFRYMENSKFVNENWDRFLSKEPEPKFDNDDLYNDNW